MTLRYLSGSQLYDYTLYLMSCCFIVLILFLAFLKINHGNLSLSSCVIHCATGNLFDHGNFVQQLLNVEDNFEKRTCHMLRNIQSIAKFITVLLLSLLITSIPMYVLRLVDSDHVYSSHWNTYSWVISFSFMESDTMGGLSLLVWAVAVTITFTYRFFFAEDSRRVTESDECMENTSHWSLSVVLAFTCSLSVTLLVNTLYVLSTTEWSLSPAASFAIRFAVSIFRILSAAIIVPFLANQVNDQERKTLFMFELLLLNNLILPCIVTAMTSSNCFQVS